MKDWRKNEKENRDYLEDKAEELNLDDLSWHAYNNIDFGVWSGSCYEHHHHYGDGGLLQHTTEVVRLCMNNGEFYSQLGHNIDFQSLYLSALFHDYGKIFDYVKVDGKWIGAPHKRQIHHISRSAMEFMVIARKRRCELSARLTDAVLHNILSHHGMREFGSPVSPNSKEAWILHLCDQMSARVNDVDLCDILKNKER
jgi:3'-5' exoribonuclease